MAKLTCPDVLVDGGTVQVDAGAVSVQAKVIGVARVPPATATLTVTLMGEPCVTWKFETELPLRLTRYRHRRGSSAGLATSRTQVGSGGTRGVGSARSHRWTPVADAA